MQQYLSLIKFSHTLFALPFALLGFFLGTLHSNEGFSWRLLVLVLLCMVFARSAAMAFNRFLDRDIDRRNPRTRQREIPAGIISPRSALLFVLVNCFLFILTTYFINAICFYLSPVALLVILGYSYTKRITFLCHFVLGLGLGLAPVGAYLTVTASFDQLPLLYGLAVLFWVSGFDIIYALQDEDFDRTLKLHSIPALLGKKQALHLSAGLHFLCGLIILATANMLGQSYPVFGWMQFAGAVIFIGLLIYQHSLVSPTDLSRVNLAFFTTNGLASLVFGFLVILDIFV